MRIATFFLSLLVSLVLAGGASAEELQPNKRYQGKVGLEVATYGLGFELPAGWTGMLPAGTEWFHVGKDNEQGRVFVYASKVSRGQMRATMSQPFPAADIVMLTPTGAVTEDGSVLVGDYTAVDSTGGQFQAHVRVVTGKGGLSVALVAVAPAEQLGTYKALARKIEKSLKFGVKPKAARGAPTGAWAARLANKRVVKFTHGSGYSEKTQFLMCGNGTFSRSFNATGSSMNGSGVAQNANSGRWSVSGNVLTLTFNDGNVANVRLEDRGGQLFVDGERWLREDYACP